MGSLAEKLGRHGAVTSDHFRSVLAGRHPFTHEQLARRRGCAQMHRGHANQPTSFDQEAYDVARVASRLRLTVGRVRQLRSEEHTSELQSLMRISYAVFCLKKKTHHL